MTRFSAYVRFAIVALSLVITFGSGAVLGDETPDKLSLTDAVAMALDNNPNLRNAQNSRSNSLAKLKIANINTSMSIESTSYLSHYTNDHARSSLFSSNYDYTNLLGTTLSLGIVPVATGEAQGNVSLTLEHPLMKGRGILSAKSNQVLGARSNATIQEKQLFLTTQSTVRSVVNAYYSAILAREQVKVQERAVSIAKTTAEDARNRADEGLVAEIEVSRAEIRVAQTENELNIRRQDAVGALDSLMIAIGSGIGNKPELIEPVPEPETVGEPPDLAAAMEKALSNRSELAEYDINLYELSRSIAMANDKLKPGLDLVASYNSTESDEGLITHSMWDAGSTIVGLDYKVPLDRRALTEEKNIAESSLVMNQRLRTYEMELIAKEIRDAYRAFETAKTSLKILGQNLAVAEENLQMAQIRVDEGLIDNQEVLNAQEALTQVQDGLLSAKVSLYLAGINLKAAMGEDLSVMGAK